MEIRFISSLTSEDERQFAMALIKAVGALLDQSPITYTLRIETSCAKVYQHSHVPGGLEPGDAGDSSQREVVTAGLGFLTASSVGPEPAV